MKIRISGLVNESIVDGKGMRAAIFLQGCPHRCEGCHNPQTHAPDGGRETDTDEIMTPVLKNGILDGITITGGEPFFQAEAASELAICAKAHGLNVWTYTGYTFEQLLSANNAAWTRLLQNTDVLVDGQFVKALRTLDKPFAGSKNQRLLDVAKSLTSGEAVEIQL